MKIDYRYDKLVVLPLFAGENAETMARRFKKACDRAGIARQLKRAQYFVSKGERRRVKSHIARRRRT